MDENVFDEEFKNIEEETNDDVETNEEGKITNKTQKQNDGNEEDEEKEKEDRKNNIEDKNDENNIEYDKNTEKQKSKRNENNNEIQKELEALYEKYFELKTEANQKRKESGEYKKEILRVLEQNGIDSTVINGPDGLVEIGIEIHEEEIIDKKNLAKTIGEGVKAKDLSNPQKLMTFFEKKLITKELIEEFTIINERELFIDRTYKPDED